MHAEQCIQLMNAGKNVLCEKPMTLNLKDAKRVLEVAKKNDVFFMEVRIHIMLTHPFNLHLPTLIFT